LMTSNNCRNSVTEIDAQIRSNFPKMQTEVLAYPEAKTGLGVHYSLLISNGGSKTIINPVCAPGFPEYFGDISLAPPMFGQMKTVPEVI